MNETRVTWWGGGKFHQGVGFIEQRIQRRVASYASPPQADASPGSTRPTRHKRTHAGQGVIHAGYVVPSESRPDDLREILNAIRYMAGPGGGWMIRWRRLICGSENRLDVSEAMIRVARGSLLKDQADQARGRHSI